MMASRTHEVRDGGDLAIKEAGELLQVPAATLRSWERRYGLPSTARSLGGHRRYNVEALNQLRLMRDEIAAGRPAADSARWVRGLLEETNPARERIDAVLAASSAMSDVAIIGCLEQARIELGLGSALDEVLLPAMRQIGSWWESGRCEIGQERFTTEVVRGWLAKMITLAPEPEVAHEILLAVGPRDFHTLGLECLAANLVLEGLGCRVLGPRTPTDALVAAVAETSPAAVVVVSHLSTSRRTTVEAVRALAQTGCPVFYAGNAFMFEPSRKDVPGTYLGETIAGATDVLLAARSS